MRGGGCSTSFWVAARRALRWRIDVRPGGELTWIWVARRRVLMWLLDVR